MSKLTKARIKMILAMMIIGTIGIVRRNTDFPSSMIAAVRGVIGALFIFLILKIKHEKIDREGIRRNIIPLLLSGACFGLNWICIFEAYRFTTVSIATLCNYMAPVLVILVSPIVLKEKLSLKKAICVLVTVTGMVLVSGILNEGLIGPKGIVLGLCAACLYCGNILSNKFIKDLSSFDTTMVQLLVASATACPYALATEKISELTINGNIIFMIVLIGVVYTGLVYFLYLGSLKDLPAQNAAILTYIEPVVAIATAILILGEKPTVMSGIGMVMILGATLVSELQSEQR